MKEIDILKYVKIVLAAKRQMAISVGVAAVIGVVVALNTPKAYTSSVVLAPELTSGMSMPGNLSDIASMVGIDIGGNSGGIDAIYPQIYPEIFASNNFVLSLFDVKVRLKDESQTKTYFEHLTQDQKIPFWSYPKMWIAALFAEKPGVGGQKLNPFMLTKKEAGVCDNIKKSIACFLDKETSVITITVTDADPQVAAIMADTVQNRLQAYILAYRTKKARNDLEFAEKYFADAKSQYEKARQKYAAYSDSNTDVILQSYKLKQEDLENDMQLKFNLYTQAATQVNAAKMKVQERTPAFTIIQDSTVPLQASSTPRSVMVLMFMLLGVMADVVWVLWIKEWWTARRGVAKIS